MWINFLPVVALFVSSSCRGQEENSIHLDSHYAAGKLSFPDNPDPNHEVITNKKLDAILNLLKSVQYDIRNMKQKIKVIDTELFAKKVEKPCIKDDITKSYIVKSCGNNSKNSKDYYTLDGDHGVFDKEGFCRVIIPSLKDTKARSYKISTELYNSYGDQGINSGYLGLAYNVKDEMNFDFVYLRLQFPDSCYRSGFVQNGKVVRPGSLSGTCPEGPPKGREWFKFEVLVQGFEAVLFLNGRQVTTVRPHFSFFPRGGVIVASGYRNVIRFRNYQIKAVDTHKFQFQSCKSRHQIGDDYYRLQGLSSEWPHGGFCRAVSKEIVESENYAISVSLYNQATPKRNEGLMGVLFNVQNNYNYDFVYFRPNSHGGCFTTGFVQNSEVQWTSNSKVGSCTGGPIKKNTWIDVNIIVQGQRVAVQIGGKHIVSSTTHFRPVGYGGVLLSNTRNNVVVFRNYRLKPMPAASFTFHQCASKTSSIGNHIILDGVHGKWPTSTFCKAVNKNFIPGQDYLVASELFIQKASAGHENGYFGLMFNVRDDHNYDFVYLTPYDYKVCFKVGFTLNNEIQWSGVLEGKCVSGKPQVGRWVTLEVLVTSGNAMISLDGNHLFTHTPHYSIIGKSGVIVGNGHRNVLSFRKFTMLKTNPLSFNFHSCGEGTHYDNNSYVLDASLPARRNPFCLAIMTRKVSKNDVQVYNLTAHFFNVDSWQGGDWGQFGFLFNVQDQNNFEFFHLNLPYKDDCYEYGQVLNGKQNYNRDYKGSCKVTPPAHKWFELKVIVQRDANDFRFLLNNQELATMKSRAPFLPNGGVLVRNGNKNVVMYKKFDIELEMKQ